MIKNKRVLSFITAILSFLTAAAFACAAIIFIIWFSAVLDFNNSALKNEFGFDLIKSAGINAFIAITGILLSFALCLFKILTGYYYIKVSAGDKLFFMQREKGTIGFCFLSALMTIFFISSVCAVKSLKPYAWIIILFATLYLLQTILPVIEIVVFEIRDKKERANKADIAEIVPTEENVKNELESEAQTTIESKEKPDF